MRKIILVLFISLFTGVNAHSQKLEENSSLENAAISYCLLDMETGAPILTYRANESMAPASCLKLFSTAGALERFGPDYRFTSEIAISGKINEGKLDGDVYIIGHGDPALGSPYFSSHYYRPRNFLTEWAVAIQKAGITQINGNIIGGETQSLMSKVPRSWIWEDIGNYFGAAPSSLCIYDNTYQLQFETPAKDGSSTKITSMQPEIPGIEFKNYVVSKKGGRDNAYIFGGPASPLRIISGSLPAGYTDFTIKGAIPDPAALAAHQLKKELEKQGIKVNGTPRSGKIPLHTKSIHTTKSPELAQLIRHTNHKSVNLYANMLCAAFDDSLVLEKACSQILQFWEAKGIDMSGAVFEDGCGLSPFNQVSAEQLAHLLHYMDTSKYSEAFKKSLPTSGETGTLLYFGHTKDFKGHFHGKSGSITRVLSYCGYLKCKSGNTYVISAISNHYHCSTPETKEAIASFFEEIYLRY